PVFERLSLDADPFEEVSADHGRRLLEALGSRAAGQPLEGGHVDGHESGVETESVPRQQGARAAPCGQVFAKAGEGLTQAMASFRRRSIPPQERDQPLARLKLARPHRQVRQQSPGLSTTNGDRWAVAQPHQEGAQQREAQSFHLPTLPEGWGTITAGGRKRSWLARPWRF